MADVYCGSFVFCIVVGLIAAGYCVHMWHILKGIANEDVDARAEKKFRNYIDNCEYRVHTQMRIVDEMGRHR